MATRRTTRVFICTRIKDTDASVGEALAEGLGEFVEVGLEAKPTAFSSC